MLLAVLSPANSHIHHMHMMCTVQSSQIMIMPCLAAVLQVCGVPGAAWRDRPIACECDHAATCPAHGSRHGGHRVCTRGGDQAPCAHPDHSRHQHPGVHLVRPAGTWLLFTLHGVSSCRQIYLLALQCVLMRLLLPLNCSLQQKSSHCLTPWFDLHPYVVTLVVSHADHPAAIHSPARGALEW